MGFQELRFEHRFVSVLSLDPNGTLDIDLTKFHETAPAPTAPEEVLTDFLLS